MTKSGDDLPVPSHLVRYVPYARLKKDPETDLPLGPEPTAFIAGVGHNYLSVTWCEYFNGTKEEKLRCAIEALRGSKLEVRPKACFCVAETGTILATLDSFGRPGRAVYHPEEDNPAHAGVYGISPDDLTLLLCLSGEVWSYFLTKDGADALPLARCTKSPNVE